MSEQRAALIDGDEVVNVVAVDPESDWEPPAGLKLVVLDDDDENHAKAQPGARRKRDGTFVAPEPDPAPVRTDHRAAVESAGTVAELRAAIAAYIAEHP